MESNNLFFCHLHNCHICRAQFGKCCLEIHTCYFHWSLLSDPTCTTTAVASWFIHFYIWLQLLFVAVSLYLMVDTSTHFFPILSVYFRYFFKVIFHYNSFICYNYISLTKKIICSKLKEKKHEFCDNHKMWEY